MTPEGRPTLDEAGLRKLLERVEEAEGPDQDVDLAIALALGLVPTGKEWKQTALATWHKNLRLDWNGARFDDCFQPGDYTASLDAAIALCEKVLPGAGWCIQHGTNGKNNAVITLLWPDKIVAIWEDAPGATPALALLAATLRALLASPPQKGEG